MIFLQTLDPTVISSVDNWFTLAALFLIITSYTIIQILIKRKDNLSNQKMIETITLNNTKVIETIDNLNRTIEELKILIKCQYVNNVDLTNALDLIEEVYTGSKDKIVRYVITEILERNNISSEYRIVEIEKKLKTEVHTLYLEDYTLLSRIMYNGTPLNNALTDKYPNEVYKNVIEIIKRISHKESNIEDLKSFIDGYFNALIKSHQDIISKF